MSSGLALVLAGGGERAVAWELGVLAGLADAGLELGTAELVIGTSAGALAGAHIAAGADPFDTAAAICAHPTARPDRSLNADEPPGPAFAEAVGAWLAAADAGHAEQRRRVGAVALEGPQGDERLVAATKRRLPAVGWSEPLTLVAIDAERGERISLRQADGVPLERAVAASRAIPGLRPVISAAGRKLMDGAVGSATNADLAAGMQRVAVVTATPAEAPPDSLFALWNAALESERVTLERAGSELLVVQAGPEDQEAMGFDMMSGARAPEAFEAGRRSGAQALASCRQPDRWRLPRSPA
ncbi:MAG TPA: patatin-like phospholipase family protein [Thermoleophilaceae bacterium]